MSRRITHGIAVALVCPACVLAVACGAGQQRLGAKETLQAWIAARNSGNAEQICKLYDAQIIAQLARGSGCLSYFSKAGPPAPRDRLKLASFDENGGTASATVVLERGPLVTYDSSLKLENGDWRVSSLGPVPGLKAFGG
jgi:hypothetical protein